jgi:hypothetical protein
MRGRAEDPSESENELMGLVVGGLASSSAKKRNVEHAQPAGPGGSANQATNGTSRSAPMSALSSLAARDWRAMLEDGWKYLPEWLASQPEFLVGVFNILLITFASYHVGATEVGRVDVDESVEYDCLKCLGLALLRAQLIVDPSLLCVCALGCFALHTALQGAEYQHIIWHAHLLLYQLHAADGNVHPGCDSRSLEFSAFDPR